MTRVIFTEQPYGIIEHPSDISRLIRVAESRGLQISEADAAMVWEKFSDGYAAGWMHMDSFFDDEIYSAILENTRPLS